MGLLDGNYMPDPLAQGLLGLGSALLTPRQMGGGLMAGANAFNQGATQAAMLRRQMAQDAMREKYLLSQMAEAEAQTAERKRATEAAQRQSAAQQAVLVQLGQPPQAGFRDANIAMTGNAPAGYTPPAAGRVQITPQMMASWIAAGGDPKKLEAVATAQDLGLPEVARTIEGADAQGRPQTTQFDKFGRPIGSALPKAYEKRFQDVGGSIGVFDPYTLARSGDITKTITPDGVQQAKDAAASRGVTLRGQNLADARARAEAERPVFDQGSGAWVYRPSADAPMGRFVQPVGPNGAPAPMRPGETAKIETDLRKEFTDLPQTKKFTAAVPAYKAIADAATRNNKQADINLVYGLAKLYDPESVVREGEYDTIANSQTIPEWIKGAAASLTGTGGRLTPATRAQILTEARGRLSSYETEFNAARSTYERIAQQRGANPANVIVPIGVDVGRTAPPADLQEAARRELERRRNGR